MAIDLNKSHYNSDGKKMRVVYPEKEVPEIYPQKKNNSQTENSSPAGTSRLEIYPQREIYPQKNISQNDNFGEIYPQTIHNMSAETPAPVKVPLLEQNVSIKASALIIGSSIALLVGAVCTIFGMIRNESEEPYDPDHIYKIPIASYYTGEILADEVETINIDLDKTDITLCADNENYSGNIKWDLCFEKGVSPMSNDADGVLNIYADTSEEKNMLEENRKAEIFLPYDFAGDIVIKSSNGSINVSDMVKGSLDIDASDSDIKIENSEITSADIFLRSSNKKSTVDLKYCAGDEFKINAKNADCYLNFCAAKKLTLYNDKHTTISDAFISEKTDIQTYEGYIRNDVFNGFTSIGMSQTADIKYCEFNGEAFVHSLNKEVFLDTVSVENIFLNSEKGNVRARLCDGRDKYSVTIDDGTYLYPETEGSGEYSLNAETDGHTIDITYGYSDGFDMIDTDEVKNFAERYGITYTDTEKNSNNNTGD